MKPMGTPDERMAGAVFKMSESERIRVGLKKAPRGALTVRVVYPVHVSASAMYYKTEMIARNEVAKWVMEHPGLVIMNGGRL